MSAFLTDALAIARFHIVLIAVLGTLTFGWLMSGHYHAELALVVGRFMFDVALEVRHLDHALTGNWRGYRDCHVFNDLVLIYQKFKKADQSKKYGAHALVLVRLGSHSELGI